jgi:penicillin-insensitive murein endopeptidase
VAAPPTSPATPTTAEAPDDHGGTPGLKPAKVLFGAVATPAPLAARAIGTYAKGCLAGGQALPVDGPAWQAMRLSRNRNWGHPRLIALVERLALDGRSKDGWPGLLVGDLAQPRGGPMLTGHASHQIGLDADIWLTPMPDRTLTRDEREKIEATSMLSEDGLAIARDNWTDAHLKILRRAASYPEVERILVHPAIKQVLCTTADGDRHWLSKVRPYWGHHYHFHVRISCPAGSSDCVPQKPVPGDDGCGKELEDWFKLLAKIKPEPQPLPIPAPPPVVAAKPPKEKPPTTLDQLPDACRVVLATGNPAANADIDAAVAAATSATTKAASTKAATTKDGATKDSATKDSAAKSAAKAAVAGTLPPKPEKPATVSEKKTVTP